MVNLEAAQAIQLGQITTTTTVTKPQSLYAFSLVDLSQLQSLQKLWNK